MIGREDGRGAREKRGQVARDRRIGFVRQPELAQAGAAIAAAGSLRPPRVSGRNSSRAASTSSRVRSTVIESPMSDRPAPRTVIGTRSAAASPSIRSLAALHSRRSDDRCVIASRMVGADLGDPALDDRGEREIEVVAAEEQVIADRHAFERRRARFDSDPDQAEVGRAASDVADECDLFVFERDRPPLFGHPRVERGDRFLQQRQRRQAAPPAPLRRSARVPLRRTTPAR